MPWWGTKAFAVGRTLPLGLFRLVASGVDGENLFTMKNTYLQRYDSHFCLAEKVESPIRTLT